MAGYKNPITTPIIKNMLVMPIIYGLLESSNHLVGNRAPVITINGIAKPQIAWPANITSKDRFTNHLIPAPIACIIDPITSPYLKL
jgi:hypothetical protein